MIARLRLWAYLAAVVSCALLAALGQTQFNLNEIAALGAPLPVEVRLRSTLYDLLGFSPTFAVLAAPALLVALPLAGWLARYLKPRWLIYALAGAAAIACALSIVNALAPMPTLIGADRYVLGRLMFMLCGACGALLFTWLTRAARLNYMEQNHA